MTKPQKQKDQLEPFRLWLINDQAIGRRTASVYTSRTRKILAALPHITSEQLDDCLRSITKQQRDGFYTAWNKFAQYCASKKITIPMPTKRTNKKEEPYEIPPVVLHCIAQIRKECRMKLETMVLLRHNHCHKIRRSSFYKVVDPEEHWVEYKVEAKNLEPIIKWGDPFQDHPDMPLLPVGAMSYEAIPIAHLRKLVRAYKRSQKK